MGIKNLNTLLRGMGSFPRGKISDLGLSVVGIDFSLFLFRFIYNQNNPVECFLRQILLFLKNNILPVYVLDGTAPIEKNNILNKRADKREKVQNELDNLLLLREKLIINNDSPGKIYILEQEIIKLEKKCVQFSKEITNTLIEFFEICGIPVIQENYESDWILAKLNQNNIIDYILSEDSDILAFGGKKILKNFCIQDESFLLYDQQYILNILKFNQKEFVDMCILCGCDYAPRIKNLNCNKSFELISKNKSIENSNIFYNQEHIDLARNIFHKEISKELLQELSDKIIKNEFQFNKIETFLNKQIEKKYLIPIFIRQCRKFIHHKISKRSISPLYQLR